MYAFRVVVGLRRSWLSREAVVFSGFAGLAGACALTAGAMRWPSFFSHLPYLSAVFPWQGVFLRMAAIAGLAGVTCSGMIYVKTPREGWSSKATLAKFFLTTFTGGLGLLGASQAVGAWVSGEPGLPVGWLYAGVILGTLAKGALEAQVLRHLKEPGWTALKKTALLLTGPFKTWVLGRLALGVAGGVLLPALLCVTWTGSMTTALLAIASAGLWIGGELVERHLFFRAVVPPKMPGAI